jgi:hypothetical protein
LAISFHLLQMEKVVIIDHRLDMTFFVWLTMASMRTYFQYIIYKYQYNGLRQVEVMATGTRIEKEVKWESDFSAQRSISRDQEALQN